MTEIILNILLSEVVAYNIDKASDGLEKVMQKLKSNKLKNRFNRLNWDSETLNYDDLNLLKVIFDKTDLKEYILEQALYGQTSHKDVELYIEGAINTCPEVSNSNVDFKNNICQLIYSQYKFLFNEFNSLSESDKYFFNNILQEIKSSEERIVKRISEKIESENVKLEEYLDFNSVKQIKYERVRNYIPRNIMEYNLANSDFMTRYLNREKVDTLNNVCLKEQYVLLIADAGSGKSIEFQNLVYRLNNQDKISSLLLSLKRYKDESIEDYIQKCAKGYEKLDLNKLILVLDGYDELENPIAFRRSLDLYMERFSESKILISMRSNFLQQVSDTFSKFRIYKLMEISDANISEKLRENNINVEIFKEECYQKKIIPLIFIPFYFFMIVEVYIKTGTIPDNTIELLNRVFEMTVRKDIQKYEYSKDNISEEEIYDLSKSLTKFAYGTHLLGENGYKVGSIKSLLNNKEISYLKNSSLINKINSKYYFTHNIFKEYIVAKYLSKLSLDNLVAAVSVDEGKEIDPRCYNILGYILQMRQDEELLTWIESVDFLVLAKSNPENIDNNIKNKVFNMVLENIVCDNVWYKEDVCKIKELAVFCESSDVLDILIEHIKNSTHFRSLYFCLKMLSEFSNLFNKDLEVKELLLLNLKSQKVRSHEKRYVIKAIVNLNLYDDEITNYLISKLEVFSSDERVGVYEYILKLDIMDKYIDLLLDMHGNRFKGSGTINTSENMRLDECIESATSSYAIKSIIKYHMDKNFTYSGGFSNNNVLYNNFIRATTYYNEGDTSLFDIAFEYLYYSLLNYQHNHIMYSIDFFINTATTDKVIVKIINLDKTCRNYCLADLIDLSIGFEDALFNLYYNGDCVDYELLKQFVEYNMYNKKIFDRFSLILKEKAGIIIPAPTPRISFDEKRKQEKQAYWDALFDKKKMEEILKSFLKEVGGLNAKINDLTSLVNRELFTVKGSETLYRVLLQFNNQNILARRYFDTINWEIFFISQVCKYLINKTANRDWEYTDAQLKTLKEEYIKLENEIDLKTAYKNDGRYVIASNYVIVLSEFLELNLTEKSAKGMLYIPSNILPGVTSVEEKYLYIVKIIGENKLKEELSQASISEEREKVLFELIYGANKYNVKGYDDIAFKLCLDKSIDMYYFLLIIEYILNNFNMNYISENLLPMLDNDKFIITVNKLQNYDYNLVSEQIIKRYNENPNIELLSLLMSIKPKEALKIYISEAKKTRTLMDDTNHSNKVIENIKDVDNKHIIDLLVELTTVYFLNEFQEKNYKTLYSSLYNVFMKSNTLSDYIVLELKKLKETNDNQDLINFCSTVCDVLADRKKESKIKIYTIKEVKCMLDSLDEDYSV